MKTTFMRGRYSLLNRRSVARLRRGINRHGRCYPRWQEVVSMPAGASKKRERQYEHIKDSYQDRGVSKDAAEERAARTVNKQRRKAGETKKKK
jgi:hypothetical protein